MKALSIREPYASLMLHGKIETRTWPTKYRGPVLICAAKQAYDAYGVWHISGKEAVDKISDILDVLFTEFMDTRGYAIAVGELVDCRPMTKDDQDKCFVLLKGTPLWCHVFENVRPIKPFPWKGKLGYTDVPQEIIDQIEYL